MESIPTTNGAQGAFCAACGAHLSVGARFCHRCGAERGAAAATRGAAVMLPWGVAALALVAVIALLAGQYFGRGPESVAEASPAMGAARAPDISSMTPQERADRLFQRVMTYVTEGKQDSAQFFAPMAIGALEALAPMTAHNRYDLGLVGLAIRDVNRAAAQADTILRAQPSHLLGLALASRAADVRGDSASQAAFDRRLLAAEAAERARRLPEYQDHEQDISLAVAAARERLK